MGSVEVKTHFKTIQTFEPDYCKGYFTQYESQRTGMQVVVVDRKGPKVWGYFVLATEIHDDSGAPHTLEHLCFMGSKSYQYKGFLDKLATRAYSGTNAWTANDHTAYTLETAGWTGFRQILPVYLEHVVLPTLKDAGCLTEVHHIDGNGLDAGVVYSEMQGTQNEADELMTLRTQRLLYPDGNGYRYETGGMMENLRVLTADRIRAFHRDMYQPKNLCLVLFGDIDHRELIQTLDDFEASILNDIPSPSLPFKRPWVESTPTQPLDKTMVETVEFPEEDESFGQIFITFLGPHCCDSVAMAALNVVFLYLSGSSAALLDNVLVEKECVASSIYFSSNLRPRTEFTFTLSGVKTDQLETVERRFFDVLKEAMDQPLDMSFMKDCVDSRVRSIRFMVESSPHALSDDIIIDYLYGRRDGSTLQEMSTLREYTDVVYNWTEAQWKSFIKSQIVEAHHISILGKPSAELSKQIKETEAQRIHDQIESLGPAGLEECAKRLAIATAENDTPIPPHDLARFKVPTTDTIKFVTTLSARVGPALSSGRPVNKYQKIVDQDAGDTPLFMDFEHIDSNFVRINLMINTSGLATQLRPLVKSYLEVFFKLPIRRNGAVISFEDVIIELERDTVGYDISTASMMGNSECVRISFQVELSKYAIGIRWIESLLFDSVFEPERLEATNSRLLADISESKRSGNGMLTACWFLHSFLPESMGRAKSTLTQALYLKALRSLLKHEPASAIAMFEEFRDSLFKFENIRILVIGDLERLQQPVSLWKSFVQRLDIDLQSLPKLIPLPELDRQVAPVAQEPGGASFIIPMAPIDSSFGLAFCRGPVGYLSPNLPALLVTIAYLNATEGPLWVAVRGTGLAYGTNVSSDLDRGFISLDIYRSPDAFKAYQASKQVIRDHIDGQTPFDPLMLEGAISSIVVGFADEQATMASAATANFVRSLIRKLPEDYMTRILHGVRNVTVDEIKSTLETLVFNLFRPDKSDVYVTCATGLVDQIQKGFEEAGYQPDVQDLTYFQDDYGLKQSDEDGGDDDDDDVETVGDDDDDEESGEESG